MNFLRYLKGISWELFLCLCMVDGFGIPMFRLFFVEESMPAALMRFTLTGLSLLLLLYLGSYHHRVLVLAVLSTAVVILAELLLSPVPALSILDSAPELLSSAFWYLILALLVLLLYLGTITPLGTAVIFLTGTVITVLMHLISLPCNLPLFILFLWAAGSMYFFRRHEKLAPQEGATPLSLVVTTAVVVGLCLLLALVCWVRVLEPMHLPTRPLPFQNESVSTQELPVQITDDAQPEISAAPSQSPQPSPTEAPVTPSPAEDGAETLSPTETDEQGERPGAQLPAFWPWVLGFLLVLLAIFYPPLKRTLWLFRTRRMPLEAQVTRSYRWLQRKLHWLGCLPVGAMTPLEYARSCEDAVPWLSALSPSWLSLTDIYISLVYDCGPVPREQVRTFFTFRAELLRAVRKNHRLRWLYLRFLFA